MLAPQAPMTPTISALLMNLKDVEKVDQKDSYSPSLLMVLEDAFGESGLCLCLWRSVIGPANSQGSI
jgi:hypothetical protein